MNGDFPTPAWVIPAGIAVLVAIAAVCVTVDWWRQWTRRVDHLTRVERVGDPEQQIATDPTLTRIADLFAEETR